MKIWRSACRGEFVGTIGDSEHAWSLRLKSAFNYGGRVEGAMISPSICPVDRIEPNQGRLLCREGGGGTISTTGTPRLVMRMGWRDWRTVSRTSAQCSRKVENAMLSIVVLYSEIPARRSRIV